MTWYSQNTAWVEIIITKCEKLHKFLGRQFLLFYTRVAVLIVIIISIRAVFLRIWLHVIKFSTKTWSGAKFSKVKVQKTSVVMFVIDWNLARYLGKTWFERNCKKTGYREFDHSGTLRILVGCLFNFSITKSGQVAHQAGAYPGFCSMKR